MILLASALAVVGHVLTFLVAARTAGSTTSTLELVPLALLVLVAMGIPANVAGWGPREGVAAWVFGAAGLGAGAGSRDRRGLRRDGARGQPARRRRAADGRAGGPSMRERPYTLLSCGISIDGYLDRGTGDRLILSNEADLDRVDDVRAGCDAILVGAATIRHDNPRLLVRKPARVERRAARGLRRTPIKVTVTRRAELDPCAAFFATGDSEKLVYCATDAVA